MNLSTYDLHSVVASIWETALGLPLGEPGAVDPEGSIVATVGVTGAWTGTVVLDCAAAVARRAAAIMFFTDEVSVTPEAMNDAVMELVNMIGGHVKALACEGCTLSLPAVAAAGAEDWVGVGGVAIHGSSLGVPVSVTVLSTAFVSN